MAHKELLISWLNDAYAMETALIPVMENHAKDAKDHPQMQARIQQHVQETRRHAEMVKQCVERLGSSTSTMKTGLGSLFGNIQSISTGAADDELVKNSLLDFGVENFEIACYKALMVAAQDFGDQEIAQVCQEILNEEMDMARWLDQHLPMVVRETFQEKVREH